MERTYTRENGRNFLCLTEQVADIDKELAGEDPQMEMIRRNHIPGILRFSREWIDNRKINKYDITGYHSLRNWLEISPLSMEKFRKFLKQLSELFRTAEEFLLNEKMISFDPEFIFVKIENEELGFCFLPPGWNREQDGIRELAAYLLDHVQEEQDLMVAVLKFYRLTGEEDLTAEKLEEFCREKGEETFPEIAEEHAAGSAENFSEPLPVKKSFFQKIREKFFKKKLKDEELWISSDPREFFEAEESRKREEEKLPKKTEDKKAERQIENWNNEPTQLLFTEEDEGTEASLLVKDSGELVKIAKVPFIVGSLPMADYRPDYRGISRMHLKIDEDEKGYFAIDMNSTNGTKINGKILEPNEITYLHHGDTLNLAGALFEFRRV